MLRKNPPTIWMNVTTSINWHRPAVGIVRVERELRDNLRKLYPLGQFKECIWQDRGFVEVEDLAPEVPVDASAGNASVNLASLNDAPEYLLPVIARRHAVMSIAQGVFSLTPNFFQPVLDRVLRKLKGLAVRVINFRAIRLARKDQLAHAMPVASELSKISATPVSKLISIFNHPFKPGDIFITIGLDWNLPFYQHLFYLRSHFCVKVVTCCYDLIPVKFPQYCASDTSNFFTSYFLSLADGSDLILCISKQSQKDLLELLEKTGGRKVETLVFSLGDNVPQYIGELSPHVIEVLSQPFILFVSSIERRKNHEVLYRAYHLLCKEGKRSQLPKLVFVGMPGWGVGDLLQDIDLDPLTKGMIVQLNHVNDAELLRLYQSSMFCVFPSLYEGWGLPVGEALSLGKAVLCSDRGSLPEVGGDLVRYVDPWNTRTWADELYRMATDDAWRLGWEEKTKTEYNVRTWLEGAASVKSALNGL